MGVNSSIQWTDATWNPWHGCKKVSPGCKYCYMYRDKERYGQDPTTVLKSKVNFYAPLFWKAPKKIFTCSWSDWFIPEADEWREDAWKIIKKCPQHTFQILTKRPERIIDHLPQDWGDGYPNVWLGVSVESQDQVHRISELTNLPASLRFISFEPLIGAITKHFVSSAIRWIIIGGESGNETGDYRYRPCDPDWIKVIIEGYRDSSPRTKIFVKQLGTHFAKLNRLTDRHAGVMDEWPECFRIREFPINPTHLTQSHTAM